MVLEGDFKALEAARNTRGLSFPKRMLFLCG